MAQGPAVSVLRITPANASLLASIAADVFDAPIEPGRLAAYLAAEGHALFVALADGRVVGQIRGIVHRQPDVAAELYIDNLGVTPSRQRQGIATQLMRALLAWGVTQGADSVWVAAEDDNALAKAFYAAFGLEVRTLAWYAGALPGRSAAELASGQATED